MNSNLPPKRRTLLIYWLAALMPVPVALMFAAFGERHVRFLGEWFSWFLLIAQTLAFTFTATAGLVWDSERKKWKNLLLLGFVGTGLAMGVAAVEGFCLALWAYDT